MKKVVIIYDTKRERSTTREVAVLLAKKLSLNYEVKIFRAEDVKAGDVEKCDIVIFGAPVYVGKVHEKVLDSIRRLRRFLTGKKVVLFTVCLLRFLGWRRYLKQMREALGRRGDVEAVIGGRIGPLNLLRAEDVHWVVDKIHEIAGG